MLPILLLIASAGCGSGQAPEQTFPHVPPARAYSLLTPEQVRLTAMKARYSEDEYVDFRLSNVGDGPIEFGPSFVLWQGLVDETWSFIEEPRYRTLEGAMVQPGGTWAGTVTPALEVEGIARRRLLVVVNRAGTTEEVTVISPEFEVL